jgi:signal transduction histidine kinase
VSAGHDLDRLPDAVLVLDSGHRLVAANAAARALLGDALDDAMGKPVGEGLDVRGPGGGPALRDNLVCDGEVELTLRGAHDQDVQVAATCRIDEAGAVLALRPSAERSGIAVISTVSHELRSPLTSVKGYTSLMLSRWERLRDDQKVTMLEQVHHDADRVTRLVTELLDISRLETGRLVLRRQMVDLPALAANVVEKVHMATSELEAGIEFEPGFPPVYADPDKLEQVLTNLVENAVKYGSPRDLRIVGRIGEDATVSVSVIDRGPGIPAEDLPRVFTKFFRRDHGRPTGTGLGLWISRGLVEAHGGELVATSDPGAGATFRFTLPTDAFERAHGG